MTDARKPRPTSLLLRIFLVLLCVVFMLCSACGAVFMFAVLSSGFHQLGLLAFATACFLVFLMLSLLAVRALRGPRERATTPGSGGGNPPDSGGGG